MNMRVFKCPNCHKAVVTSTDGMANKMLLRCVHCGYSDYAYAFGFKTRRSKDHANVTDIVDAIHKIVFSKHFRTYNPETLVEDLHNRQRMIDHITLCEIINATIDNFAEKDRPSLPNLLRFVEVGSNTVSIDTLLEQVKKYIPHDCEPSPTPEAYEIEALRQRCCDLSKEKQAWEDAYQHLDEEHSKLKQENQSLQDEISVLKYKISRL